MVLNQWVFYLEHWYGFLLDVFSTRVCVEVFTGVDWLVNHLDEIRGSEDTLFAQTYLVIWKYQALCKQALKSTTRLLGFFNAFFLVLDLCDKNIFFHWLYFFQWQLQTSFDYQSSVHPFHYNPLQLSIKMHINFFVGNKKDFKHCVIKPSSHQLDRWALLAPFSLFPISQKKLKSEIGKQNNCNY